MRATLGILPVAILGLGCSNLRPWTPSVSVAFWAESVPSGTAYDLGTSTELAARWSVPSASVWSRYGKGTLFSAVDPMDGLATLPDVRRLDVVHKASAAAARVAEAGLPPNTLWLVDLRGAASAAFASRLSFEAREPIAPVVTFNNWPAPEGLVPADETLAGLVAFPPKLPPPDEAALRAAHPVFLLDSWRLAFRFDDPGDDTYDNRYMLFPSDLPDIEVLRQQAITRVIYVVEDLDDAEVEEDDLHATFRAWQAEGISIYFVDLDTLESGGLATRGWEPVLRTCRYYPGERYTLVDDPRFYYRARGGFGLSYGRPHIYRGYGAWSYGSHHPGYGAAYHPGPGGPASHGGFGG